jgi:hypothetical protein
MPGRLSFQVVQDRPLIEVEVKPSLVFQQVFASNAPHLVPFTKQLFLVDTGATFCVIDEGLVANWRLPKNNPVIVGSGTQISAAGWRYDLSLKLRDSQGGCWIHNLVPVATVQPGHFGAEVFTGIIGMDILKQAVFNLDGPSGSCSLTW